VVGDGEKFVIDLKAFTSFAGTQVLAIDPRAPRYIGNAASSLATCAGRGVSGGFGDAWERVEIEPSQSVNRS
jgi:hypothetical protein